MFSSILAVATISSEANFWVLLPSEVSTKLHSIFLHSFMRQT